MLLFVLAALLIGVASAQVCTLGVKYALPPTGVNRFRPPVISTNLTAALHGTVLSCEPLDVARVVACPQSQDHNSFWLNTTSEDCLALNVFAPANARSLPVSVFFFGGSFVSGSISVPLYDGARVANSSNSIVVTVNYRLGALGFLSLPALATESNTTGNWGLLDQIAALNWISQNIDTFGGDAARVTIFGESAGGASVCALATAPAANGLFSAAIMESGLCQDATPLAVATQVSMGVAGALLCAPTDLTCLRAAPWRQIVAVQQTAGGAAQKALYTPWAPTVDGVVLRDTPLNLIAAGRTVKSLQRVLIGTNLNESNIFLFSSEEGRNMTLVDLYHQLVSTFGRTSQQAQQLISLYLPASGMSSGPLHVTKSALAAAAIESDFVFTCPSQAVASLLSQHGVETYAYVFGRSPSCLYDYVPQVLWPLLGASHSFELSFVFSMNPSFKKCSPDQDDVELSARIVDYWQAVVAGGPPSTKRKGGVVNWPKFDNVTRQSVYLDAPTDSLVAAYRIKHCLALGIVA